VLTIREPEYSPYFMKTLEGDRVRPIFPEASKKYVRRQDAPVAYRPTGAVYATRTRVILEENRILGEDTRGLILSFEESINIDTIWDFKMAELLVKEGAATFPRDV
jgi:CMP-N-acetylneuraminic acid synthetase